MQWTNARANVRYARAASTLPLGSGCCEAADDAITANE